ncbi:MAG: cell division protein FtsA [Verrucomicrobiales bacterium]|nr:cell division protein FtsA [Verrucomicrobiales bacterium]
MARSVIYVGLEIGTSKVCVVVGEVRSDGAIKILGVGQHPSAGVRKGEIVDFETVQQCLHDALVKAEDRSDVMVKNVFLAVTGAHIESLNNRGTIRIADDQAEITPENLEEVKEIARDVSLPGENAYIHSIIQHYYVDGQEKVLNPVGMLGQKLEADYHIIHGVKTRIQNAIRCVREVPLEVEDIVFSPIAAAQVVLNREAKQQGALLIDIGGGTTEYVLYIEGAVVASGCLGIGGDHITNDLSIVLKIPLTRAEKLKIERCSARIDDIAPDAYVDLEADTHFKGSKVEQIVVNEVVNARISEVFELIRERLETTGQLRKVGKGIFLTGGVSLTGGIAELAEEIFELPVQRNTSASMSGPAAIFENPQYATPVGLIRYAQLLDEQRPQGGPLSNLGKKFGRFFGRGR